MDPERSVRRLAAIMFTDIVGYTALMAESEEAGLRVRERHRGLVKPLCEARHGEVQDETGDELLLSFPSALDAVNCALAVQNALADDPELVLRIGIHLGDVVFEGGRVYGDGVNVASRVRALAEPGGIAVTRVVRHSIQNQPHIELKSLGEHELKNVPRLVKVFAVSGTPGPVTPRARARGRGRLRTALLSAAGVLVVTAGTVWIAWPYLLGALLDLAGVAGPPVNPPLPDRPSIVVLPFTNMSDDSEQGYFSDGITEDLITDLSGISQLFVISRNSAFTYKDQSVKVEDVGRELGVRYVLKGSVRKADGQVRITAQLIDATTGFHLWSERYDRALSDIFGLQAEISEEILSALNMEIREAELERIRRKPTDELTAYDAYLEGLSYFTHLTREDNARAKRMFEQAIEMDPEYAEAYAMLGLTYSIVCGVGWDSDPAIGDYATELANRALDLNPFLSEAYQTFATVHLHMGRSEEAVVAGKRAVELNPNNEAAHFLLGFALFAEGKFLESMQSLKRALRLNPRFPSAPWLVSGYINFRAGRVQEAVELWEQLRAANPEMISVRLPLASYYEANGRHEDARALADEILRVNPEFDVEYAELITPGSISQDTVALLRSAGIP